MIRATPPLPLYALMERTVTTLLFYPAFDYKDWEKPRINVTKETVIRFEFEQSTTE